MRSSVLCVMLGFFSFTAVACQRAPEARPSTEVVGIVDHHVHVLGPEIIRDWKALGVNFSKPESLYSSVATLLARNGGSLRRVTLVPMSHLYANPEFVAALKLDGDEVHRRVRRENRWVAQDAARHPGRADAFCSVPALAGWALDELAWCHDSLRSAGIKLHVASSQVDLREPAHLERLAAIASFAAARRLPLLLHVDPQRRGHDSTHIRAFAERVLGPYPELTVGIAHLGGSGGYGPWTRTVYRTLRGWLRDVEQRGPRRPVYFELSAVALEQESEGVPAMTSDEAALLREDLRRDAFDRVIFGSDYPVFDPVQGARALVTLLGLTSAEVAALTQASAWR
jgi:uncharacterized protein